MAKPANPDPLNPSPNPIIAPGHGPLSPPTTPAIEHAPVVDISEDLLPENGGFADKETREELEK